MFVRERDGVGNQFVHVVDTVLRIDLPFIFIFKSRQFKHLFNAFRQWRHGDLQKVAEEFRERLDLCVRFRIAGFEIRRYEKFDKRLMLFQRNAYNGAHFPNQPALLEREPCKLLN